MEDIESLDPGFMAEPKPKPDSPAKPTELLSLRMEPGFLCFFPEWVQSRKVSMDQCYDLVMRSHLHLEKLRWPIDKLLARDDLSLNQKSLEVFSRTTKHERFFVQGRNDDLYINAYAKEKEERIKQLEMQVELYRRRREEALEAKREQFRKVAGQQQEALRRVAEEQQRRQRVLDEVTRELNDASRGLSAHGEASTVLD